MLSQLCTWQLKRSTVRPTCLLYSARALPTTRCLAAGVQIRAVTLTGTAITLEGCPSTTIRDLKAQICAKMGGCKRVLEGFP